MGKSSPTHGFNAARREAAARKPYAWLLPLALTVAACSKDPGQQPAPQHTAPAAKVEPERPAAIPGPGANPQAASVAREAQTPVPTSKLTSALFNRILEEEMTETQVTAILGPGKRTNAPAASPDQTEVEWADEFNSFTIQFHTADGKAAGGESKIAE